MAGIVETIPSVFWLERCGIITHEQIKDIRDKIASGYLVEVLFMIQQFR